MRIGRHSTDNTNRRTGLCVVVVSVLVSALMGLPAGSVGAAQEVDSARLGGQNRYETAARVALASHPDGADTVLIASGRNFPDALAGGGLAGVVDGPLLLTDPQAMPLETAMALSELEPSTVLVLGGDAAVSDEVVEAIDADVVERIEGEDRYATAAAIAGRIGPTIGTLAGESTALVATGENFPDALAIGALAFRLHMPVLLVREGSVPESTVEALTELGIERVVIAGGSSVINAEVEEQLEGTVGNPAIRLAGVDRTQTASLVADFATRFGEFSGTEVVLTNGATFADAIAAGPYAGSRGAPILLTDPSAVPDSVTAYALLNDAVIDTVTAVGGALAVPTAVLDEVVANATSDPEAVIFTVDLSFVNEVDADGTFFAGQREAAGVAVLKLSPNKGTVAYLLDAATVAPPFTDAPGAHIHEADLSDNGPAVALLATAAELQDGRGGVAGYIREDTFADSSLAVADFIARPQDFYVNVHSAAYPTGAIRGQLPDGGQTEVADAVGPLSFSLDAEHELTTEGTEVQYGASTEEGTAAVTLDFDLHAGSITYRLDVSELHGDLAGGAGAPIHEGLIDQNGPIVVPLATGDELANAVDGVVTGTVTASDFVEDFSDLSVRSMFVAISDFYVNVHTTENPAGAVRGQLPDGGELPTS